MGTQIFPEKLESMIKNRLKNEPCESFEHAVDNFWKDQLCKNCMGLGVAFEQVVVRHGKVPHVVCWDASWGSRRLKPCDECTATGLASITAVTKWFNMMLTFQEKGNLQLHTSRRGESYSLTKCPACNRQAVLWKPI